MQTLFQQQDTPSEKLWAVLRSHRVTASLVMLATFVAIVAGVGYQRFAYAQSPDPNFNSQVAHPAYRDTHPRVLFDAAHFNFHTATGNYKPFADLIRNDGYEVVSNKKTFSRKTLGGYRVLVIANALGSKGVLVMLANLMGWHSALQWDLAAFTPEECDAVRDWVAEGGSLLLISDHAPTGKAAQGLSLRFGVDMSNWFTEDDQHSDPDAYSFLVFSRDNGLLISSPITEGRNPNERLNRVMTFTGQSLKGPQESVSFLRLADSAREYPGRESTFPAGRPAAGRAQGIALTFGKGRAVVLGEAAMLSAQVFRIPGRELRLGMEYPGCDNRQLALNIMHWLSGLLN
jgi:hypothetical protein